MEMVFRALAIYLILLVVFKIAGRRALLQMTSFDLILLLIISEATQQALLGNDFSVTGAMLTIITAGGGRYPVWANEKVYFRRGVRARWLPRGAGGRRGTVNR
ncbi:Uncharacterised protein [Raoultella terrigena]|uniref:DUF421 domain-containing protein n=1 Tax=Raoultella terrigena TaxID=577 RepID=A0A3P8KPY9_RAOTE|nr:Uncharacterised protein [Raoultella terrigena]